MKKILIGSVIGIFILGIAIGMIGMVAGVFTSSFEMTAGGIVIALMSLLFIVGLPMVADVIEEYFF